LEWRDNSTNNNQKKITMTTIIPQIFAVAEKSILEKFLRYVVIDTQSKEDSVTYPSTPNQWNLIRLLETELKNIGVPKVTVDEYGYVMAEIPSNLPPSKKIPAIGFIAHIDTSPEVSGSDVKPQVIPNYQGGDITLPGDTSVKITMEHNPALTNNIGKTIITSDGTTLLGADNKAGVAVIMALAELLIQHPEILHGDIKIAFTPDEEVGAGTKYFDIKKFGAQFAYTIDGENAAELNKETFSANTAIVTVDGINTHPGTAKNLMINSIRVMAEIIARLPKDMAPETTEHYEPYMHPYVLDGGVAKTSLKLLFRDFKTSGLDDLKIRLKKILDEVNVLYPKAKIDLQIHEAYRNMLEALEKDRRVVDYLWEATLRTGLNPVWRPIRGGTDGSQLSAKGLPTPNIFCGSTGHHSKAEWVSLWEMRQALEVVLNLISIWIEKAN
jgi:tripeptide aminopeptidase